MRGDADDSGISDRALVESLLRDLDDAAQRWADRIAEAESTAYAAGALLGLDTSSWSIGYVAGWSNADVDLIRSTAGNVLRAVNTIADALLGDEDDAAA